jgi:hypothetical protein
MAVASSSAENGRRSEVRASDERERRGSESRNTEQADASNEGAEYTRRKCVAT